MNTPNNKRRQETRKRIERTFVQLLQTHELEDISITALCREANINRTTFYANYLDIYDLVDAVGKSLETEVQSFYSEEQDSAIEPLDFLQLYRHIYNNQIFYKTYFKLGLDAKFDLPDYLKQNELTQPIDRALAYRIAFFRAGLNAVLKEWLSGGCMESPEEIHDIIRTEYAPRETIG